MTDGPGRPRLVRTVAIVALAIGVAVAGAVVPAAAQHDQSTTVVHREQQVSVDGTGTTTVEQSSTVRAGGKVRVKRIKNEVEVNNRRDGRVRIRSDFELDKTSRPAWHAVNTASAFASCVDCRTAALAFQVVLSEQGAVWTADNHAAAVNIECASCDTLAVAFQFVVVTDGEVTLTRSGRSQLRDLDRELRSLRHSGASGAQLAAAAESIAAQVLAVLQAEVVMEPSPDMLGPMRSAGVSVQLYRDVDTNPAA